MLHGPGWHWRLFSVVLEALVIPVNLIQATIVHIIAFRPVVVTFLVPLVLLVLLVLLVPLVLLVLLVSTLNLYVLANAHLSKPFRIHDPLHERLHIPQGIPNLHPWHLGTLVFAHVQT